jgi:putative transcriptional regulator
LVGARQCAEHGALHHAGAGAARQCEGTGLSRAWVDATTEAEIERQAASDDAEAAKDAAAWVRRVRRRAGLSQAEFARRIGISAATVRAWEQGKLVPQGAARALLRVIDRVPEAVLALSAS